MYRILDKQFYFVATEKIPQERLKIGYKDASLDYSYCINAYESSALFQKAMSLANESDIVIIGSAPEEFVKDRILRDNLTFRYYERIFRKGLIRLLDPRVAINCYLTHTRYRSNKLHMLCASAYTAYDMSRIFAYPNKCWKWGYFPEIHHYKIDTILDTKPKKRIHILWVGRFLKLKHPEYAIIIAKKLKDNNFPFLLSLIGDGIVRKEIERMVLNEGLENNVEFLGAMSPDAVRNLMVKANIFLFTSDKQEGWGAVLNEAMNSGCAIVASDAIGSVPFLIQNNVNGLTFKNKNTQDLYLKVESLFLDPEKCKTLGRHAYETMISHWNPSIAAERFVEFCNIILRGGLVNFNDGPCSKANIIKG